MSYLPDIYKRFLADYPELARTYDDVSAAAHRVGPLDERCQRVARLAMAVADEAEGAVRSNVRKALEEGFSKAEIEHVIVLALTMVGFPAMIASLQWAREVFDAEGKP